jgi:hypothetical protein
MSNLFAPSPLPSVISDLSAVDALLLAQLELTSDQLWQALLAGMADAALTTEHSSAGAFGTRLWDGSITTLRDQLKPLGWRAARPGGLEVVRRGDNGVQVSCALGDDFVGIDGAVAPNWEHPRGTSTARAVSVNQQSFASLMPADESFSPIQTWWLLYGVFFEGSQKLLRAEISLPIHMDATDSNRWKFRLLLGQREFGDTVAARIPAPAPNPPVVVSRRTSNS